MDGDAIGTPRIVSYWVEGVPVQQTVGASSPIPSGDYLLFSPTWDNEGTSDAGAVTWGNGATGTFGTISAANSARGTTSGQGATLNYQSANNDQRVVVGRDVDQIVTILDLVPPPNKIIVQKSGGGGGTITSSPAGINCGATCTANFANGASVTLTATPAAGSTFLGWTGPCEGTGTTCTVTVNQLRLVSASFAATSHQLSVSRSGNGSGTVTSNPAGINCGTTCSAMFDAGAEVVLSAQTAQGSTFTGWSGACSGEYECRVTMNAVQSVTANFALDVGSGPFALTVARAGAGSGTVTSVPAGINCGADCAESYAAGTSVTLTAAPGAGSIFAGWGGACSGTGNCQVTMNGAKSVTATFVPQGAGPFTLTVARAGLGSGTVTSSPAGINCGADCTENFPVGTTVTLTPAPASGSSFTGWSGACSGTGSCTVTMSSAQAVTARFALVGQPDDDALFLPHVRR